MADSLTKVGTITHYHTVGKAPNWADSVPVDYVLSRRLISYFSSASVLESIAPEVPVSAELNFQFHSKEEEYNFISFFVARRGRWRRFWIQHPVAAFTLKTSASSGATGLACKRNRFDLAYKGYERIYIEMTTGDLIVRKITSVVDSESSSYTYIGLDASIDRDVTLTNHAKIGRYLLARFDNDKLTMRHLTSSVSETTLRIIELVKEYSLAD